MADNGTLGRIQTFTCPKPEPEIPPGTPVMTEWDGVHRGSPAEEYLKKARGGLDPVRGDSYHHQQSANTSDALIGEALGAGVGYVLKLGGKLVGAAKGAVKPAAKPAPASPKPVASGGGNGVAVAKKTYGPKDFVSEHAYKRHGHDPNKASKPNHTRYADNVDPKNIADETINNPDKIEKLYDSNGNHYATKYSKDMQYNISQPPVNSSQSRVFINHADPAKSTQFPFGK